MKSMFLIPAIVGVAVASLVGCRSGGPKEVAHPPTGAKFQKTSYDSEAKSLMVVLADGTSVTHYGVPVSVATEFNEQAYKMGFYRSVIERYYATSQELKVEGRVFQPVRSKVFRGARYEDASKTLYVLRAGGSVEKFTGVPVEIYQGFLDAPVKNAYYVGNIEQAFPQSVEAVKEATDPKPE